MLKNAAMKSELAKIVLGHVADYKYIALKAKYHNIILIFDKNGDLKGMLKAPYF